MSQKSKKKSKKIPPPHSNQVHEATAPVYTTEDELRDTRASLRIRTNDNEELQYQISVLERRLSALTYGMTLMEKEKEEDHRIKFNLRNSFRNN